MPCRCSRATLMSSAYIATMPTLQIRNSAGTAMWIHKAPGKAARTAAIGSMTSR